MIQSKAHMVEKYGFIDVAVLKAGVCMKNNTTVGSVMRLSSRGSIVLGYLSFQTS